MSEIGEFFEWADHPEIPMVEVRKRYEELKASGVFGQETPAREELVFILGERDLFWKHMVELGTFKDCQCWTDGEVVGVLKKDKKTIKKILYCLKGRIVESWLH